MQHLPTIITKHWIGYAAILGVGFGVTAMIWAMIYALAGTPSLSATAGVALLFASAVVLLISIVQVWVYSLSYVEITEEAIRVVNYRTLFWKSNSVTEWVRVQDVTVQSANIFATSFNYGTLVVQTAGTEQGLILPMIPDPTYWQAVVAQLADQATS